MKSKLLGLGLGLTLSTLGVAAVPATAAFADTCYTGCTTALTSPPLVTTPAPIPLAEPTPVAAGGGLPFTGADIEGMAVAGAGALVVGGLMVRRSRRLRQTAA